LTKSCIESTCFQKQLIFSLRLDLEQYEMKQWKQVRRKKKQEQHKEKQNNTREKEKQRTVGFVWPRDEKTTHQQPFAAERK
jgi:hypothetical protein